MFLYDSAVVFNLQSYYIIRVFVSAVGLLKVRRPIFLLMFMKKYHLISVLFLIFCHYGVFDWQLRKIGL
jgi:hypothetical protein